MQPDFMNEKPKYINGVFANEVVFRDGGSILKLSIPADKIDALTGQLKAAAKDGWVKLKLSKMREPKVNANGKTIATHSLSVDDWQPKGNAQAQPVAIQNTPPTHQPIENDDVPF